MDYLHLFSDDFVSAILQEMMEKHDFIVKYIFKDPNEIWKYIYFLINLIKQIGMGGLFRLLEALIYGNLRFDKGTD
jgi:hypothetical protein